MFKCALVKPIGLLSQHAAEEMALNGFRGVHVCVCDCEQNHSCFSMGLIVLCLWMCICLLHMLSYVHNSYVVTFELQLSCRSPAITLLVWLRGDGRRVMSVCLVCLLMPNQPPGPRLGHNLVSNPILHLGRNGIKPNPVYRFPLRSILNCIQLDLLVIYYKDAYYCINRYCETLRHH